MPGGLSAGLVFKNLSNKSPHPDSGIWEISACGILGPRGGGLPYKNDGDARRKIKIKPLRETNVGVA